ncbi:MAG: amino acid ABC transporter substrate-binding protein [marine bacterium B5-7]|nr:MAG: amino acid ABC transporter substrate-binding protein [marine bacterium B5-7]
MNLLKIAAYTTAIVSASFVATSYAATLDDVKANGAVTCGVSQGLPGFSNPDDQGNWSGLDVDTCRAVAAAVFGDATKANFKPLSAKTRFTALTSGEIDMLPRNTTETLSRDAQHGNFPGVNYYDGQGFMVRKDLGVSSAKELGGAAVCTNTGTTTELNVADYFRSLGLEYTVVAFEKADEVVAAYDAGRCDVYTTDQSGIAAQRTKLADPSAHVILPEIISKEPLGPMVRHGDDQWFDIVKWSLNCMVDAEELGISSANIDEMKGSDNPGIQRILGESGDLGQLLGLPNEFCYSIVKQVGNYGESFDRNVGPDTPLGLSRGLNALWKDGGIMYAAPFR